MNLKREGDAEQLPCSVTELRIDARRRRRRQNAFTFSRNGSRHGVTFAARSYGDGVDSVSVRKFEL